MVMAGCSGNAQSVGSARGVCSSRCFNHHTAHSEADAS